MNLLSQDGYIDNTDLATTAGQPGGAWASYTPTVTNTTNTTATGKYMQLGKTVYFWAKITCSASPTFTAPVTITMPVTAVAAPELSLFNGSAFDTSETRTFRIQASASTTTTVTLAAFAESRNYTFLTNIGGSGASTVPFEASFATGDTVIISGFYEAA
jgi:hypothetical protein